MKKSFIIVSALAILALLLGACAAPAAPQAPAAQPTAASAAAQPTAAPAAAQPAAAEGIYIPVISKGFQHLFWQAVKQGAETAAKDYNVQITFEGPELESQVDKQVEMVQAAMAKNPKCLALAALDSKALASQLAEAKAKGIPVVGFDSGVEGDIPVTTASTDNIAAAGYAADKMAELIGGEGKVAVIVHDQTSITGITRRDGFVNRIKEKYPKIEVVAVQYGEGKHDKSADLAKAIMQANPDLKGIFGANEGSAIGVINAVKEMDKAGKLVVIGYDASKTQKDAVRSGLMQGAITQDPVGIGYKAVEACVKAIKGETLPKNIDTGFKWWDKTNVDAEEMKMLLYD